LNSLLTLKVKELVYYSILVLWYHDYPSGGHFTYPKKQIRSLSPVVMTNFSACQ